MSNETMIHPFTKNRCEVVHLQPGAVLEPGDIYRSATYAEDGSAIGPDAPGLGRWYFVSPVLEGSIIGAACNVHFMRLLPIPEPEANA